MKIREYEIKPNANLYGANLREAYLGGAGLREANLREAYLGGADLRGADLYGANLREAYLGGADLRGADLYGANLGGANLYGANLGGANLGGADLSRANLRGANLREADLRGANLREADLSGAYLSRDSAIDAGQDFRGYRFVAVRHDDDPMISAGCRWFSLTEALDWWSQKGKSVECLDKVRMIEAEAKRRGWIDDDTNSDS